MRNRVGEDKNLRSVGEDKNFSSEEDHHVQKWDKEEERINVAIQELKQRQKTMKITECVKGARDMKKLQKDITTAQT
jgi:hypothetical protein